MGDFLIRVVPVLVLLSALYLPGCTPARVPESAAPRDVAFWVWHRTSPVADAELERLQDLGVSALFQHAANFSKQNAEWEWQSVSPVSHSDSNMRVVPVVRIGAGEDFSTDPAGITRLVSAIRHYLKGASEVQLDYDCPDRLLGEYAERLSVLKSELPEIRLSVTALGGWIQRSGFKDVAARVDAIYPMFYDLEADLPAAARESRLHPIAGSAMQLDLIGAWAACKTPWHAGLPNFSRLSIFDPEGNLKGHLRDWRWDEVIFHPLLESVEAESRLGVTLLRATQSTRIGNARVEPGDHIVLRQPAWEPVQEMVTAAITAGASGVAWFRLPGPGEPNAWTASHLVARSDAADPVLPVLTLLPDQQLSFENISPEDIPPRFHGSSGKNDRGWKLEIDVPEPGWILDAGAGEFMQMLAHYDPEVPEPLPVHVMRARRLTFWFSHLPAGSELVTASLYLAPGKDPGALRWRFEGGDWQPLLVEP